MHFDEAHEGDYRIFAGALEAPQGDGYIAALVVQRVPDNAAATAAAATGAGRAAAPQRDAYRDESLACGYRWRSADEALHYALNRAREMIRTRSRMLAC